MDCMRLRQLTLEGGDLASAEARRHLDQCAACRALFADGGNLARLLAAAQPLRGPAETPSFADLEHRIAGERSPWRRLAELPSRVRAALAVSALAVPVLVAATRLRYNLDVYPAARLVLELGALAGLILASLWIWIRPLYKPQLAPGILWAVLALALALPWALAAFPAALPGEGPIAPFGAPGELRRAASCFLFGTMTALPALVVVAGLGRRSAGLPGFALLPATAAALAGLLGLHLHCPEVSPAHLLLGHATVALALPLLLVVVGVVRGGRRRQPS
jgi:Zn-finger nucleic acid-binding protein